MERSKIDRINDLARKSKSAGLTPEELEEQKVLRQEYIRAFRNDLKQTLDSIVVVDKDGNRTKLPKRNN